MLFGLFGNCSRGVRHLQARVQEQRLGVVGMMYDVVSGEVHVIDETRHGV